MNRLAVLWRRWVTVPYLAPIYRQVGAEIPDGATVFDLGCASGELLLGLAPRIDSGLGIDLDEALITVAADRADREGHHNLTFADGDVSEMLRMLPVQPSVTILSLLLHTLSRQDARLLLQRLAQISDRLLLVDYVEPPPLTTRLLLGFGGIEPGYFSEGVIPGLLKGAGLTIEKEIKTAIPSLRIWVVARGLGEAR